jgi:regulator of sigma E protease
MVVFDYLFAAIPMLGILIFVHEFGHFALAKLCGVRVLKFSLGFGPAIGFGSHRLRWERGGTEYVIAWIPLGGFVRLLGEMLPGDESQSSLIPDDAQPHEFLNTKPIWQKIAITFAGPATNLLLPVVIFMLMLWSGIPKTLAVVGMVERDSPAAHAGVEIGDRILEVAGEPIHWWSDVHQRIQLHDAGSVEFLLERAGEPLAITVPLGSRSALDLLGDVKEVGWVGLDSRRLPALLGVADMASGAGAAGLRSGDWVVAVGDREVEDWREFAEAYSAVPIGEEVSLRVREGGMGEEGPEREVVVPALGDVEALGVLSATVLVRTVQEGMPAANAGLRRGDLILEVDGKAVGSFRTFADTVRSSEGRSLEIAYARDGEVSRVAVTPVLREVPGPFEIDGMEENAYLVGIVHAMASLPGVVGLDRERNPLIALPRAVSMTLDNITLLLRGLGKLISGQADSDQLRGPITIVQIARKSLDMGWQTYLGMMIFISINLGILNLLPIPILDGGQLLLYFIEGIKRSPLSLATQEFVQQIGFVVLAMMVGLAFWNDLSGQWAKFIEWLSNEL